MPFSPQSDARKKGKHYFVKDRTYGYHCLNCDCASQELDVLKAMPCVAPKGSEKRVEATLNAEIELENLRDLEAEGLQLQELLNFEQEQLEQMMLQAEIDELERQVAQEEYELHEAKIRSLEDAAIEAKKRPLCEPPTASDSKHAAATARDAQLVDHTATAGNAKQVDQTATAGNAEQVDQTATAGDAEQVGQSATAGNAEQVDPAPVAKRPRIEQSSTAVVSRAGSVDAETLAKNALLGGPSMPSVTGALAKYIHACIHMCFEN